jgi:hypothetical protein
MIIDDVLANCSPKARPALEKSIQGATILKIQDVSDYFWLHTQNEWDIEKDFPVIRPPWLKVWMEWRTPPVARIKGEVRAMQRQDDVAVFAEYRDAKTNSQGVIGDLSFLYCSAASGVLSEQHFPIKADGSFMRIESQTPAGRCGIVMPWTLNPEVFVIKDEERIVASSSPEQLNALRSMFQVCWAYPAMLALSFCHCKNLKPREETISPALQKARKRRGRFPVSRYYTLDIGPMKKVIEQAKRDGNITDLRSALHMVRGHFKTYTEDAPLFGSQTGTYWWGMHARGDAAHGTIKKDYEVRPPAA